MLIGDRFIDVDREVISYPEAQFEGRDPHRVMLQVVSDRRSKIAELKAEWERWWKKHSQLTAVEIGRLMIERSLRVFAADPLSTNDWSTMAADSCLEKWTGQLYYLREWNDWWDKNKATYKGPTKHRKQSPMAPECDR